MINLGTIVWVVSVLEIILPYLTIKMTFAGVIKQIQLNNIIKGIVHSKMNAWKMNMLNITFNCII